MDKFKWNLRSISKNFPNLGGGGAGPQHERRSSHTDGTWKAYIF